MEKGRNRLSLDHEIGIRRSLASHPPYNRKSQSEFRCQRCHHEQHADVVGARNIRDAARRIRAQAACRPALGLDNLPNAG